MYKSNCINNCINKSWWGKTKDSGAVATFETLMSRLVTFDDQVSKFSISQNDGSNGWQRVMLRVEMGIVFLNERNYKNEIFVEKGEIRKKRMMDVGNGLFRERKQW